MVCVWLSLITMHHYDGFRDNVVRVHDRLLYLDLRLLGVETFFISVVKASLKRSLCLGATIFTVYS